MLNTRRSVRRVLGVSGRTTGAARTVRSLIRVRLIGKASRPTVPAPDPVRMGSTVLSLRIDGELLDRLRQHAARRGMSVQDYVLRTLVRDDFDERFKVAVDETEKFYGVT